jgi:predicted transcriptional regulator
MFNTLYIYDELSQTMDPKSARKLVDVMSSMYEELRNSVTKEEFSELRGTVQQLAEAQTRTEERLTVLAGRVDELVEAQKRTETRVEELAEAQKRTETRVEELAEAQKRTETRVEELAEAQTRTEERLTVLMERVDKLAEAQTRTEKAVFHLSKRLDQTNKHLGGLNMTVGYTLENEAYRFLPELLRRDWQIETLEPLHRDWMPNKRGKMVEVNIVGRGSRHGETLLLLGESKLQLSRKYVDAFLKTRIRQIDTGELTAFPIIIAHMESEPGVVAYAREQGMAVYLSYQFHQ